MISRRKLLQHMGAVPVAGSLLVLPKSLQPHLQPETGTSRDFFKELGVRTFINAAGTYTALTGCMMHPNVVEAIEYASKQYVTLDEIQDKVGERIAELLHCEYATVTAGCFSAITLGTAGVITGLDPKKADQLPNDFTGLKSEVILQKSHRVGYDHAIKNTGAKIVEVETREDLEKAIKENTAMMWFLNYHSNDGQIGPEEWVAIGKKHGIPTMNDCAADVPPVENLWKYTKMGFDLVCFSGGKGIRGPQSAGLLLGRKDLVKAARLSAPPRGSTIGRGMKVNKEEVLGMLVALETYLSRDHEADWKLWEGQIKQINDSVADIPGVETEIHVPEIANHVPSIRVRWDQEKIAMTPNEVRDALRKGHPSIETVGGGESVDMTTWMLQAGEERIVGKRLAEILTGAAKT